MIGGADVNFLAMIEPSWWSAVINDYRMYPICGRSLLVCRSVDNAAPSSGSICEGVDHDVGYGDYRAVAGGRRTADGRDG